MGHGALLGGHTRLLLPAVIVLGVAGALWTRAAMHQAHPGRDAENARLEAAIADVEAGRKTTPLIGEAAASGNFTVTFLAKSSGGEVPRVVSDVTGWGENVADDTFDFTVGRMSRVGSTDWYSLETGVAPRARIEYLIVHGRDYRLDPNNPRQTKIRAGGPASEFVTPGYVPPEEFADMVPAGKSTETTVESRALGGWRRAIVYTPPGYYEDGGYPLAVFQYGVRLAEGVRTPLAVGPGTQRPPIEPDVAPRVLDHLIARRAIEPIVAVFLESGRYGDTRDYPPAAMRTFLTREVPDWAASRYGVARSADKRAVLGISAGARDVVDAGITAPAAFGRLGLLIPGRRVAREPNLETMIGRAAGRLRVTILAGRYDHANLPTARTLRQAFTDAGHTVEWIEVAEGHTQATWRNHMPEVLVSLFGPG